MNGTIAPPVPCCGHTAPTVDPAPPAPVVIEDPHIPLDPQAVQQLHRTAALRGCRHAVGMPDLHAGPGIPIGACFAFDRVRPALVGSDAGCGVRVMVVNGKKRGDALERRLRAAFSEPMPELANCEREVATNAWQFGLSGIAAADRLPEDLRTLAAHMTQEDNLPASGPPLESLPGLGTIGGGNHFAEISRVVSIDDPALAERLGITPASTVLVVHSGSRGVGAAVQAQPREDDLPDDAQATYLGNLAGAVRFAVVNRFLLAWRLMTALGAARPNRVLGHFDVVHNSVVPYDLDGQQVWLHRKGAAPAAAGQPTIVLGSRGTLSFIMRGQGHGPTLASVAHGAGRRLTRSDAFRRFKKPHAKQALTKTRLGGRVICNQPKLLYEEHPDAYKPIEPVIAALETQAMATRAVSLAPMMTVKQ